MTIVNKDTFGFKDFVSLADFNDLKAAYAETVEMLANAMKRITQLENAIFKHDEEGEIIKDAEDEPVISLETVKAPEKPVVIKEPETRTEHRAALLVKELEASKKDYLSTNEIIHFLKAKLPESCKLNKVKNIWKVKQDVIKTAKEMYPDVDYDKKKYGHKDVRLVLKSHNLS